MRRLATRVLAVMAVAVATACDGGEGLIGVPEIDGTYDLRTANGTEMPSVLYQDATTLVELLSGRLTLKSDRTFTATHSLRQTDPGQSVTYVADCSGTYAVLGDGVTFHEDEDELELCGGEYLATLAGRTLTVEYNVDFVAVYSR